MAKLDDCIRLDMAVHAKTPSLSRSFAQKLIKEGKVAVNEETVLYPSHKVNPDDKITVDYRQEKIPKINLPVIHEDGECVVIDKPAGILSHSKGGFNPEPTVATWLQKRLETRDQRLEKNTLNSKFQSQVSREGIVHRLDRATSGVMICAKNPQAHIWLQKQFSTKKVIKTYFALVEGEMNPSQALIDLPIERNPKSPQRFKVNHTGKTAQTEYRTVKRFTYGGREFSLLELSPKTGRTHQLRVHLNYLKKPILGDTFYDGRSADRLYLHAAKLEITLPNKKRQTFVSKLPDNFLRPKVND
ncbi:RluA family pseudouridine synthase [Candidatus Parcubacteria bacterium]|nr:RluA family pseudouridine synthase [Candidatus Parcubacteria bacterium]